MQSPNVNLGQVILKPAPGSAFYKRAQFHLSSLLTEFLEAQKEIIRLECEVDSLNIQIAKYKENSRGGAE